MSELDIFFDYLLEINRVLIFLDNSLLVTVRLIFMNDFTMNNFPLQVIRVRLIIIVYKVIFDFMWNHFKKENLWAIVLYGVDPRVIVYVLLLCELELGLGLLLLI